MEISVMEGAEGNDILIADLLAQAPALSKAEVMGV